MPTAATAVASDEYEGAGAASSGAASSGAAACKKPKAGARPLPKPRALVAKMPNDAGLLESAFAASKELRPAEQLAGIERDLVHTLIQARLSRPQAVKQLEAAGYREPDVSVYLMRAGIIAGPAERVVQRAGGG